jgi:hypothetical protein
VGKGRRKKRILNGDIKVKMKYGWRKRRKREGGQGRNCKI